MEEPSPLVENTSHKSNRLTSLGINNSGELTMTYGKEDIDYKVDGDPNSGFIFNAAENVFWRRIRKLMHSQLQAMYLDRESAGCWSANSTITEFDTWQEQFPEELWRLDIERKYLRTYLAGTPRFFRTMMNGRKKYQRRQFERDQDPYMGTKYVGTNVRSDQIMFRCNTPQSAVVAPDYTLHIVPYSDMYLTVLYGNSPAPQQIRAKAGVEYKITTDLTEMDDTAILIYCASRIQELNDISACYIHDNDFSKASKLKVLIIGNTTEGYSNSFLTTLNMGNNTLLETLDLRNCPNLTGSINLSNCSNLISLYAQGTSVTSVLFANNGKIKNVYLPATINGLTFRNLNYLTNLNVDSYDNLETFICEYSIVDALAIMNDAYDTIQTVRLLGIDWVLPQTTLLNNILKMSSSYLSGTVYISGAVRNKELSDYDSAWSDLEVTYDSANLVTQYIVTFVNYDGTVLNRQYVDRGSVPYDPITAGEITTPTREQDAQYTYTYTGWDDLDSITLIDRTVTAQYSSTIRSYTVTWYSRAGLSLGSVTANYGDEVVYPNDTPTRTDEESSYVYNVFAGWDKSTGYITGDIDVYAIWERGELPKLGTELKDMSVAQVYGVAVSGNTGNYWEPKDYIDIQMGNDFNFSNVEQQVLAEELWLDGNTHIDTGVKLFGSAEKSFTLAIDFEYYDTSLTDATILSCFEEDGIEGFRLRYNSYPQIQWGDKTQRIGYGSERGMVVIRHTAGTNTITVYAFDIGDNDYCYTDTMTITELTRSRTTNTEATIVLGAIKFLADGGYDYHTEGWIHWAKLWYADLGDDVAKQLASWNRETWRFEFIDAQRYRLAGNTSAKSNASFICNHYLSKLHKMNNSSTNVGGWDASLMHTFFKNRIYNAFPTKWKSVMKKVKIPASIGNKSTDIVNSEDFVYLPSSIEMSATGYTDAPYNNEGITIPWYTTDNARLKFRGYIVPDGVNFYNTSDDPTSVSGNSVNDGDVWIKGNSRYRYISSQNSKHKDFAQSDHLSASDGGLWFASRYGWTRSANVSTTTSLITVNSSGGMATTGANNSYSVCPCFSI